MTLSSSLRGPGGSNSLISNDEIRFECSSSLSIAAFFTAKELVEMMKEVGISVYTKDEGENSSLKEGPRSVSMLS